MSKVIRMMVAPAVKVYLESDSVRQQAISTRRGKARTLNTLAKTMGSTFTADMSTVHIEATIATLRGNGARSELSLNTDRYNLQSFVGWLHHNNLLSPYVQPCAAIQAVKEKKFTKEVSDEILTPDQVTALFVVAEATHARSLVTVAIGVYGMLRESEQLDLRWRNIHLGEAEPYIEYYRRKQDDYHRIPISEDLATHLVAWRTWLEGRGHVIEDDHYVVCRRLPGGRGKKVNPYLPVDPSQSCYSIVPDLHRMYRQVGVLNTAQMGGHTLRRTGACHLYEATKDIELVRQMLGHTDQRTTMIYLRHRNGYHDLNKAIRAYNPYGVTRKGDSGNVVAFRPRKIG